MFLASFRVAISWAVKQPLYYAIKVLGLAIGIMSVALLIAYVDFVKKYDSQVPNRDQVYRLVAEYVSRENHVKIRTDNGSNAWIEPFRREYAGQYDSTGVLVGRNGVFVRDTAVYDQEYYFADEGVIPLFGLGLVQGDAATALTGPNKLLLSESAAVKYFGTADNAIGKTLTLDRVHYLAVSGVFRDLPKQTSVPMEALVSFATTERAISEVTLKNTLWIMSNRYTVFVKFKDQQQARAVNDDLNAFVYRRSPEQDIPILKRNQFTLRLQPLTDIYLDPLTNNSNGDDFTRRNTYYGIWILTSLVILGACVNYISLTIGQLQLRLKELGVRTSFGATKPALVMQLVAESLLVSGPAVLMSLMLLEMLVPVFAAVVAVPLAISDVLTLKIWGGIALMTLLLCAFVSAAPVLFASQNSIKGTVLKRRAASFSWMTGSAVIFFQFAISTLSALLVLGIYLQVNLLQNANAGFDPHNLVVTNTRYGTATADPSGFESMKSELAQIPEVESVAAVSVTPPGATSFTNWIGIAEGQPVEQTVTHITVNPDFVTTYRIPLIAGRNFSLDYPSELIAGKDTPKQALGILITRSAVKRFGFKSPEDAVGQSFRYTLDKDGRTYTVIGVVEDFRFSPMESDVRLIAILQGTTEPLRNLTMRLRDGYGADTVDKINAVWKRHLSGVPFNTAFMESVISAEIAGKTQSLALAASMAAIVFFCTAVIGIYAQASFVCDRNSKSIAIRKVLGGTKASILKLLLTQFSLPVIASFAVALPVSIYFLRQFYSTFKETPGFPVLLYVMCMAGIVALALITVFTHCLRAAAQHPIRALRCE